MGRADETPQRSKIPSCIFHQSLSQFADAEATDLPANGAKALETPNSARATTSRIDAVFMVHCGATWLFNLETLEPDVPRMMWTFVFPI
jgi:hypothetical protein